MSSSPSSSQDSSNSLILKLILYLCPRIETHLKSLLTQLEDDFNRMEWDCYKYILTPDIYSPSLYQSIPYSASFQQLLTYQYNCFKQTNEFKDWVYHKEEFKNDYFTFTYLLSILSKNNWNQLYLHILKGYITSGSISMCHLALFNKQTNKKKKM